MASNIGDIPVRPEDARGGMDPEEQADHRILIDPYHDWVDGEGVPLHTGFGVDLREAEVAPWARYGTNGAVIDVAGRGDFLSLFLLELPPGGRAEPQKHLFEVIAYVISGTGNTVVSEGATQHSFEWGPKSTFCLPLNERYQFFNSSGTETARIAMVTSLPLVLNYFHNLDFVFNNDFRFSERLGKDEFYNGSGDALYATNKGVAKHLWETSFVPDLGHFARMKALPTRGKGSTNIGFVFGDGTIHAHMSEIPVGGYKKAHRHPAGFHIFAVTGKGYSLLWNEGEEKDKVRVDWEHGVCYAPPDKMFHQHFNVSSEPARYFAVGPVGGYRYPFKADAMMVRTGADVKQAGDQIEYEDESPEMREIYLKELANTGVRFTMDD